MGAESESLVIWRDGELGWLASYSLDVLPRMRASDLIGLVRDVAVTGDMVEYEGRFYSVNGHGLRPLTNGQVNDRGVKVTHGS